MNAFATTRSQPRGWLRRRLACALLLSLQTLNANAGPDGSQALEHLALIHGKEYGLLQGLAGWWPADRHAKDIAAGHDALLHGDGTFGPGVRHSAFALDGAGDYVEVPDDGTLNVSTGDFTVDLWVKFNNTNGEQVLVEKWVQAEPCTSTGWTLTKLGGVDVIRLALASRASGEIDIDSDQLTLPVDTWLFFTARRMGDEFSIFMDGVPIAGLAVDDGLDLDAPANLSFGARSTPGGRRFFLDGAIDEVRLTLGRALTDEEIASIYLDGVSSEESP